MAGGSPAYVQVFSSESSKAAECPLACELYDGRKDGHPITTPTVRGSKI